MAKSKIIQDATFGELHHDGARLWSTSAKVFFLGREWTIPLSVRISKSGIDRNQIRAHAQFATEHRDLMLQAEERLLAHARSLVEWPQYAKLKSLDGLVTPIEVTFPGSRSEPTLGILFDCIWDPSLGLGVRIVNGRIDEVGPQDIAI